MSPRSSKRSSWPTLAAARSCRRLQSLGFLLRFQLFGQRLDLLKRRAQMHDDRGGDVLGLGQPLLGVSLLVAQPGDIEVVVPRLDLLAGEAAEAPCLALILALGLAVGIVAEGLLELREMLRA